MGGVANAELLQTPTESGIRNLPIIAGAGLLSVLAGFVVGIWGQWVPLMLFGIIVATIGCGLIYTFDINTGSPMWIGAQAMAGIGFGTVFQLPITANQAIVEPQDISSVSAITFFFQIMGAAIWISAAQAVFANRLLAAVTAERLGQNPHSLLRIGADGLQRNFDSATLRYVIGAYNKGLRAAFALSIAVAGVAVLFALLPKWEKVRPSAPSNAAKEGKESSAEEA